MQQFTVPQFIDVEDKIIGPITARQFVIMLSGFLLIALCYKIFSFVAFIIIGLMIFAISGVFAFLKINGMPFHYFLLNFTQTSMRPAKRVWNHRISRDLKEEFEKEAKVTEVPVAPKKPVTTSRLAELSLIVDTKGVYQGEDETDNVKIMPEESPSKSIHLVS